MMSPYVYPEYSTYRSGYHSVPVVKKSELYSSLVKAQEVLGQGFVEVAMRAKFCWAYSRIFILISSRPDINTESLSQPD